jgi:hypothetical protein
MLKQFTVLAVVLLTALVSCSARQPQSLDTSALIGERESLTHLRMLDGGTGETRIFIPGPDMTAALDWIESLAAQRETDQAPRSGYLYWIAGYRAGEEAFRLQLGGEVVNVDGVQFRPEQNLAADLDALFERVAYGSLVEMAMTDLSAELGIATDEVLPISVQPFTFPDASLGVPQEGMLYAQVETPGYIIWLTAGGEMYSYHGAGAKVFRAE